MRAFERAIELTDDPMLQADLHERAGIVAIAGARGDEATEHFERAIVLFESEGATHPAARVTARLGEVHWDRGRIQEALGAMRDALDVLAGEEPDADTAALTAQLGRFTFFSGDPERALESVEAALVTAEALSLHEVLAQALNTKGVILNSRGRFVEALALMSQALETALEHDKPSAALRAYFNLVEFNSQADRFEDAADTVSAGLTYARRVGSRYWEYALLGAVYPHFVLGRWDELLAMLGELPEYRWSELRISFYGLIGPGLGVLVNRGETDEAERVVTMLAEFEHSGDVQERGVFHMGAAKVALARGDYGTALEHAQAGWATRDITGIAHEVTKESFVTTVEAALGLGDLRVAGAMIDELEAIPLGSKTQYLRAHGMRFRSRLSALGGREAEAERGFKGAAALFREVACPFSLAVTLLEHAEWAGAEAAGAQLTEAREIFDGLEAVPWIERCDAAVATTARVPAEAT